MKNFFLGFFSAALLISLAVFVYLRIGYAEVRGDIPASSFEARLLEPAVRAGEYPFDL